MTRPPSPVPRVALRVPGEVASALGCSVDYVRTHIAPELRLYRSGGIVLVTVAELEDYLRRSSARVAE